MEYIDKVILEYPKVFSGGIKYFEAHIMNILYDNGNIIIVFNYYCPYYNIWFYVEDENGLMVHIMANHNIQKVLKEYIIQITK